MSLRESRTPTPSTPSSRRTRWQPRGREPSCCCCAWTSHCTQRGCHHEVSIAEYMRCRRRRRAPEVLHDELVRGHHDLGRARHGERLGLVEVDLPARGGAGRHLLRGVHVAVGGVRELVEAHDEAACGDGPARRSRRDQGTCWA